MINRLNCAPSKIYLFEICILKINIIRTDVAISYFSLLTSRLQAKFVDGEN